MSDTSEHEPRSVLVTGGNRGIGRAIAEAFLANGDRVAVTTRSGGAPEGALDVRCDITDPVAVDAAFSKVEQEHGPVEVLVANAGITADTLVLRMSDDDWSSVIDTNLTGSFRLAKRAAKGMLRLRRGRIVFISSVVGLLGSAGQVNYAASKAGLVGMARSLARELGSRSITANVVAPGFIETDMTAALTDDQKATIKTQVPLGRYGSVDEVAGTVLWLTGHDLPPLHLVYGLTPLAVSFFAEQLRLVAAQTELDRRQLEGRAAIEALPEAQRRELVRAILRREIGVMAASAVVVALLGVRASGWF